MTAVRLSVRQVAKRWTVDAALATVCFDVASGELVVVCGRSGSGKSTLLGILAGLCAADAGEVFVDGERCPPEPPWGLVALVPQALALPVELSLRESVEVAAGGRTGSADDVLAALDLADLADRPPDRVSVGQQQRAAVARAVVAVPRVLLADEPTAHQDAAHAGAVLAALRGVALGGAAVVVATHEPLVIAAADRVVELD